MVQGLGQRLASAWDGLRTRASQMTGVLGSILERLRALLDRLIAWGQQIWSGIQQQWATLTTTVGGWMQALRDRLSSAWDRVRKQASSLWSRLTALWSRLWQWAKQQASRLVAGVRSLWGRIRGFSIGSVIDKLGKFGTLVRAVEQAVQNPDAAMKPYVDAIAAKLQAGMPAKAIEVGAQRMRETGKGQGGTVPAQSTATGMVQRQPASPAPTATPAGVATEPRTTASWPEIWAGFVAAIKYKWSLLSIWQMVKDMLWSLIWPWPAVGHELVLLWTVDLTNAVHSLFLPRNPVADFWGFLHDLWTDILHLLDIPLAILRRLNNMRCC